MPSEIDQIARGSQDALGAARHFGSRYRQRELAAAAVESSQRNLYAFDPAMSYASDEMVSADPTFWKRK